MLGQVVKGTACLVVLGAGFYYLKLQRRRNSPRVASSEQTETIKLGFWNMLSDGLSQNEFMCRGGDKRCTAWEARQTKVLSVIIGLLESCDVVGVVENDHFHSILNGLTKHFGPGKVGGKYLLTKVGTSPAFRLGIPNEGSTFLSECSDAKVAAEYAKLYGADVNAPYKVDDGVSLYYRKDRVVAADSPDLVVDKAATSLKQQFRTKTGQQVMVVVAHLKSGETKKDGESRQDQVIAICQSLDESQNNAVIMDSNFSTAYPLGIETNMIIREHGLVNVVPEAGNECFKMRHGQGNQPNKFGQMMFDTIDKILIPVTATSKTISAPLSFKKNRFTEKERKILENIRSNVSGVREALREECTRGKWSPDCTNTQSKYLPTALMQSLYPNENAPSDHPPVAAAITF